VSETPSISKPSKCSTTSTTYLSMLKQLSKNVMVASSQGTTKSSAATVVFGMRWSTSSSRLTGCKGRVPKQNESDDKTVMKCVMRSMRPKQTQDSTIKHQQPSTTLNNHQQPSTTINNHQVCSARDHPYSPSYPRCVRLFATHSTTPLWLRSCLLLEGQGRFRCWRPFPILAGLN
jgi:hypothetical protein